MPRRLSPSNPAARWKAWSAIPPASPLAKAGLSVRLKNGDFQQHDYVETGADGKFRLANLPRGPMLTIAVSKGDYVGKDVDLVLLSESLEKLDVALEPMPDGGSIAGIVRDHEGQPLAGRRVDQFRPVVESGTHGQDRPRWPIPHG